MNRISICILLLAMACNNPSTDKQASKDLDLVKYVDPYIGTGFHGHVFLGASVPFGAVQLGPVNVTEGWDWCSGYHYSDSTIIGFSHTHLSGTGIGDLGDICFMPVTGQVPMKGRAKDQQSGYYSLFSHDEETARPGYYSVRLKRYDIKAELTTTERVGLHQYTYPATDTPKVIIDLESGIGWDAPAETFVQQVNDSTVAGYRYSKGWAADQRIYFTAVFSKPLRSFAVYDSSALLSGNTGKGQRIRGVASFAGTDKIMVKVGISPVSTGNAQQNITAELPGWDFAGTVDKATASWNAELNRIQVESNDTARLRTFYTAMYHTMIAPSLFNDHNSDYLGTDKKEYKNVKFKNLTTFSLWDTYRGLHPLFTFFQHDRINDIVNSMLAVYQQQGSLPIWHLMGNETYCMPGYSSVQVVADAYLKGFRGFDTALAFEAVKATAMQDNRGLKWVKQYGFIPADSMVENVAMGMEYAIADWGIAQMAKKMGKQEDYEYFSKRALNYRNYFDPAVGFMRGRLDQNTWRTPFSPFQARHGKDDFTEGNAWQYTWLAPQDVEGLMQLLGGPEKFIGKLDSLFTVHGDMGEEASSDITGLIGQYAHGNEPSHHVAYLYAFAGQPWKTADKVRYIMDSLYTDKFDGLCGNEDVGQMSAWYVLSALGFYQVNPSNGVFVFGSPVMDRAVIRLADGKSLEMVVKENSSTNKYIQDISFNGKALGRSWMSYAQLMEGGKMVIRMGAKPSAEFGVDKATWPVSATMP